MRIRMRAVIALVAAAVALAGGMQASADSLTVKTVQGKVRGKAISDGKVKAFLGLPYAAPPVGELRWRAPQSAARWKGVRDATRFSSHCAQTNVFEDMTFQDEGPSEDCLYLNVYAPASAKAKSKLPVMFWIHGGAFSSGSASEPRYNGDFLPLKGVVLVTINYRLGVYGFLATTELVKEGDGRAGNYALMDMIAALEWVKNNISKLGGDPANVTIFGESAGSTAVSTLMASPMAQNLFAKGIGESGSGLIASLGRGPLSDAEKAGDAWMEQAGATSLKGLRAMPADEVLKAAGKMGITAFAPVIDGKVLIESVAATYAAGRQAHVPLLAGWNRDETFAQGLTVEQWKAQAEKLFGERAAEFLKLYSGETNEQALRSAIDFGGDSFIAYGTWKWIEAQVKTGAAPVYRYHMELAAPPSKFHPESSAFHSDDIEYIFGTLDTRPDCIWRPEDRKLSDEMMSYWTNFAKAGDPNGPGLPDWPRYDKASDVIHLDAKITAAPDTLRARYEFLDSEPALSKPF
jgi:para-nitrobenzyl esterase